MWQGHEAPSWHNGMFHCNTSLTHSLSVYTCCDFVRSTQQTQTFFWLVTQFFSERLCDEPKVRLRWRLPTDHLRECLSGMPVIPSRQIFFREISTRALVISEIIAPAVFGWVKMLFLVQETDMSRIDH